MNEKENLTQEELAKKKVEEENKRQEERRKRRSKRTKIGIFSLLVVGVMVSAGMYYINPKTAEVVDETIGLVVGEDDVVANDDETTEPTETVEEKPTIVIQGKTIQTERIETKYGISVELPKEMELITVSENDSPMFESFNKKSTLYGIRIGIYKEDFPEGEKWYPVFQNKSKNLKRLDEKVKIDNWDYVYKIDKSKESGEGLLFVKFVSNTEFISIGVSTDRDIISQELKNALTNFASTIEY